jgi:hypothetical protein
MNNIKIFEESGISCLERGPGVVYPFSLADGCVAKIIISTKYTKRDDNAVAFR